MFELYFSPFEKHSDVFTIQVWALNLTIEEGVANSWSELWACVSIVWFPFINQSIVNGEYLQDPGHIFSTYNSASISSVFLKLCYNQYEDVSVISINVI